MRSRTLFLSCLSLVSISFVSMLNAEEKDSAPNALPRSAEVKAALKAYERKVEELEEKLQEQKAAAREQLQDALRKGLKKSIDQKNDDEVKRITALMDDESLGKSSGKATTTNSNRRKKDGNGSTAADEAKQATEQLHPDKQFLELMAGTTCRVPMNNAQGFGLWKFNADGTLAIDDVQVGRWAVISDRKVITYLSDGEWVDLFQFSLDGSTFEVGNIGSGAKATRNPGTVVK